MAKDGKHVIHAGGIFHNPLLNREGAAAVATKPGTIGFFAAGKFTASVDGNEQAILYVADYDYLRCQTVDDVIPAGELVVGIHPLEGMFLNVRAAAGTYKKGQPLTIANGMAKAAGSTDNVRGYVEEDVALTVVAGDLLRIVIK
ncbi:hypothetical protein [Atlantibacter hermannii]|uniref:hypothetical protein n=1 Tax=Atlantibacter hermannii TaxID=565 RepID=UPI0028B05E58|nr:hypothetical protein [Atlantibacter hermannii]